RHSVCPRAGVWNDSSAQVNYTEFLVVSIQIGASDQHLCPEFCSQFGLETQFQIILPSLKSLKSLEFLVRRFEFRITVMDDFRRSALERFFRRDALEPALLE